MKNNLTPKLISFLQSNHSGSIESNNHLERLQMTIEANNIHKSSGGGDRASVKTEKVQESLKSSRKK